MVPEMQETNPVEVENKGQNGKEEQGERYPCPRLAKEQRSTSSADVPQM